MKLRLLILLAAAALAAAPAAGQTIKSLGYNTTNGQIVYSGTNALTFTNALQFATNARATTRTNLGLGGSDSVTFSNLSLSGNGSLAIGGMNVTAITSGIDLAFKRAGSTELELKTNGLILHVGSYAFSGGNTNGASTTRLNLGLGATNEPTFSNIQLGIFGAGGDTGFVGRNAGGLFSLHGTNVSTSVPAFYGWSGIANTAFSAATARTNLGLGASNDVVFNSLELDGVGLATDESSFFSLSINTNFGGIKFVNGSTPMFTVTSTSATFATNVSVAGSLTVGSLTTTTPSTWALDATQTAAATNGRLTLPSNANVIRLTNNNAISSVTNGVLGAFYYLVNQATNAVTISNVGGITIDGAQNLTLSPNESATLVATGATNVSVANRGDLTDVALGGTANTAPSQTASSGSSLMTRGLSDTRFYPLASYWQRAGDMETFNGAGTGQETWAEISPIVNMVTPFSRAPRVVPAADGSVTEGVFPIPAGWPSGATVRTTTYFVLAPSQSTTNTIFIRTYAFWTTNSSILTPVQNSMSSVFPEALSGDQTVTGTGTNAEYFAVTNTFTFATNANPQNRSIMFGRGGSQPTDTATNTIYFIGSHVELLP